MALAPTYANQIRDLLFGGPRRLSLHTDDPGTTGANEVVNQSGSVYARQDVTMSPTTDGAAQNLEDAVFDEMPQVRITHIAFWTQADEFVVGVPFEPAEIPFGSTYRIRAGRILFDVLQS